MRNDIINAQSNQFAALYMRLSVEDGEGNESASIATQRKILHEFASKNNFPVFDEYIDDGFSGTNFQRPAFERMLKDITRGNVQIVLTKDFSRLGRNSARTTDLLDEYFPAQRVRYISVTDNYDSTHLTGNTAVTTPLIMAMHEMYARDTSHKIKSALAAKIRNGEFIGSFAPFGYEKDVNNRNHLVLDPIASQIVRQIFNQACKGDSPGTIAAQLTKNNVLTPLMYRYCKYPHLNASEQVGIEKWSSSSVRKILKNPSYLGHTLQGKYEKLSFKSDTVITRPKEDWVLVKDTHEPLVDQISWDLIQQMLHSRNLERTSGFTNLFSGIAHCSDCGCSMSTVGSRRKNSVATLACGKYKLHGKNACTNHHIAYETLLSVVTQSIKHAIKSCEKDEQFTQALYKQIEADWEKLKPDHNFQKNLQRNLDSISHKIEQLYDDKYANRISDTHFHCLLEKYEGVESSAREALQLFKIDQAPLECLDKSLINGIIQKYTNPESLTPLLLHSFIDKIIIYQAMDGMNKDGIKCRQQRIDIHLNFQSKEEITHIKL